MSFFALGLMEVLVLLAGSGGLASNDLVSLVQTEDYFKARGVALSADKMAELAGKDPADGKTQVQQLLAIRWLGENAADAKKADGARALLEQIAAGKKAQDPQGFARGHALQALARLDGKPIPPLAALPDKGLRSEALRWFPADTTLAGGYEMRGGKTGDKVLEQIRKLIAKSVPDKERAVAFDVLETVGNVRIDRVAGAFQIEDKGNARRIYLRFTGAADSKRILDFIALASKGRVKPETRKGPGGEEVTFVAREEMAFAFVGNSEFFVLGDPEGKNGADLIGEVLAVKAGKKKSLGEGSLGALLRGVPEDARILFAGEVPEEARKGMTAKGSPLRAAPKNFLFHAVGEEKLTLSLSGTLKDKEEAEAFAESLLGLKQMGLKALDNLPPQEMVPPEVLKRFKQTLQAAKVAADGSSVTGKVTLDSAEVLGDVLKLLMIHSERSPDKPERR